GKPPVQWGRISVQRLFRTVHTVYTVCPKITPSMSNFSLPLQMNHIKAPLLEGGQGGVSSEIENNDNKSTDRQKLIFVNNHPLHIFSL
ncbi:MAG: hypothetical protein IKN12_11360, partial [Selenomonadaceae bacterium]|nr:hypothetical protein [Selenomonadaceae bacterium]